MLETPDARLYVAALDRGMRILEALSASREPLTLAEIAVATGLGRSPTQRLVYTLTHLGYLYRHPDSARYEPSPKMLRFSDPFIGQNRVSTLIKPLLVQLSEATGETTAWVKRAGDDIVVTESVRSKAFSRVSISIGQRFPALPSASGQVILAHEPPTEAERLLADSGALVLQRLNWRTVDDMHRHLDAVRKKGYATSLASDDKFSVSLAAPVFDRDQVVGAFNVSAPASRYPSEEAETALSQAVCQAAASASRLLSVQV